MSERRPSSERLPAQRWREYIEAHLPGSFKAEPGAFRKSHYEVVPPHGLTMINGILFTQSVEDEPDNVRPLSDGELTHHASYDVYLQSPLAANGTLMCLSISADSEEMVISNGQDSYFASELSGEESNKVEAQALDTLLNRLEALEANGHLRPFEEHE